MRRPRDGPTIGELSAVVPAALHANVAGDEGFAVPAITHDSRAVASQGHVRLPARRAPRRALVRPGGSSLPGLRRCSSTTACACDDVAAAGDVAQLDRRRHPARVGSGRRGGERQPVDGASRRRHHRDQRQDDDEHARSPPSCARPATRRASSARCPAPTPPRRRRSCRLVSPSMRDQGRPLGGDGGVVARPGPASRRRHPLRRRRVHQSRTRPSRPARHGRGVLPAPSRCCSSPVGRWSESSTSTITHGRRLFDAAPIEMVPYGRHRVSDVEVTAAAIAFTWRGARVQVPLGGAFNVINATGRGDDRRGDRDRHRCHRCRTRVRRAPCPAASSGSPSTPAPRRRSTSSSTSPTHPMASRR